MGFIMSTDQLLQQIVNAISLGSIYALFALGYAVVLSVLGVLNLAHSAVFAWGAIFGLLLVKLHTLGDAVAAANPNGVLVLGINVPAEWFAAFPQVPLWVAFPLAVLLCGLLAVVLERVAFQPLRKRNAPRLSQLISSIGASLLLVNIGQLVMTQVFGNTLDYFPTDIVSNAPIAWLPVRITPLRVLVVVVALVLMGGLQYFFARTRTGRAVRTVSFNERIGALLGVDTERIFALTFFIAGMLGGAAGMLYGLIFTNVEPFMGDKVSLVGLVAIVLGGIGSINGAVLGGFLVAALQTASVVLGGGSYRNTVIFLLLFIFLVVRPEGFLGQKRQDRA